MQETWIQSLGREDPPPQYSCLGNPMNSPWGSQRLNSRPHTQYGRVMELTGGVKWDGEAILPAALGNGNIAVCKSFCDLKTQSWSYISRTWEHLSVDTWQNARNSRESFHNTTQSSAMNTLLVLGKQIFNIFLNEGGDLNEKSLMSAKQMSKSKKCIKYYDLEDKCLGTTHNICYFCTIAMNLHIF